MGLYQTAMSTGDSVSGGVCAVVGALSASVSREELKGTCKKLIGVFRVIRTGDSCRDSYRDSYRQPSVWLCGVGGAASR